MDKMPKCYQPTCAVNTDCSKAVKNWICERCEWKTDFNKLIFDPGNNEQNK